MVKKTSKQSAKKLKGLSDWEISAMKEHLQELNSNKADGESEVLAKIAGLPEPDRTIAKRLHVIIKASAPSLSPKTWYGMPAYAKGDKVICFFQTMQKFKTRYTLLGFSDKAHLDDGNMWPVSLAIKKLTATEEAKIAALVKKAVS